MPNTPRIPPAKLQELRDALRALAELPDYAPVNPECTIASLFEAEASMLAETHEEQRQRRGLDLQRDKAIGSEQRFYRLMRAAGALNGEVFNAPARPDAGPLQPLCAAPLPSHRPSFAPSVIHAARRPLRLAGLRAYRVGSSTKGCSGSRA